MIYKFLKIKLIRRQFFKSRILRGIVEYMVYPSDLRRVTTTENLGICTPHRSTQDPHGGGPGPGILCDAVGGELDHINHGFRPRQDQANQPEPVRSVQTSRID